jgi:serine/threonine protein kinase
MAGPFQCSACQRAFEEPGFCPFDGKPLVEVARADHPTVLSSFVQAQSDADLGDTQQPAPPTSTQPGVAPEPDPTKKIRSLSASDSAVAAIESFKKDRVSEYDRLVGETLGGRYFVIAKIGEGGMGVVFSARHAVIERPLAIKVLKREVMRDVATIRRFEQEAKAASRIGHPNIVDVTDFVTTPEGLTFSVMEFVDGLTLAKVIKHGAPLPPERAIKIASQIARALGAAHDKGIVHRDLKPENVFLIDREGRTDFVKIVDFGIAKVTPLEGTDAGPRLTRAGSVFGTPEYMAPEQAAGRGDTDRRVDIYALGTILYEMIVGRVPHKSNSMVRTIAMQMLDPITPPSQVHPDLAVPKSLEALIMKALAKKREERFQTMPEMLRALDAVAAELDTPEPTLSLPPLPPGASTATTETDLKQTQPEVAGGGPRRAKPLTKPLHEPEFVSSSQPPSFQHVFAEATPTERRARRWPLALALAAVGVGSAVTVIAVIKARSDQPVAADRRDAGDVVATHAIDAMRIAEPPADAAAIEAPADATVVAVIPTDASVRVVPRGDAGVGSGLRPDPKRRIIVEVLTRPAEANIFVGKTFRGPSGTRLEETFGTKLTIECKLPHYFGKREIVFDGSVTAVLCTASTRIPMCVEGLQNPFDECETPEPKSP